MPNLVMVKSVENAAAAPTLNAQRDEAAAHKYLSEFRLQGEFFSISEASLRKYFTQVITPAASPAYHQEVDNAINELNDK